MRDSAHFCDMLVERMIDRAWVERATSEPDRTEDHGDGTRHYIKQIPEFGNRWLRIVVNLEDGPGTRVTAFFDRRLKEEP